MTLPDTVENQAAYPQSSTQQAGLGFPLCRMVALICLGSGALLDAATGPCAGKGSDEQALLRTLLDTLQANDILLGDAYYAMWSWRLAQHQDDAWHAKSRQAAREDIRAHGHPKKQR